MLLDQDQLKASAVIDPQIDEFIRKNPLPSFDWSDWEHMRTISAAGEQASAQQIGPPNLEVLTEEYFDVPLRDGTTSTIKVHKPVKTPAQGSPLVVFAFGGGFISGSCEQGTPFARMLVKAFGVTFVSISYRLAPQHQFPTQQNDAWDNVKWIADNARKLGADPSRGFVMSGVSAGGQIAATVVTKAIEEPLAYPFTGQWLCVPSIMDPAHTPEKYRDFHRSLEHNATAPILNSSSMDFIDAYTKCDKNSPLRYPTNSTAPLSKQPRAFIQTCGLDPLRDDALIWDEVLKEASVPTRLNFYPGAPHVHWALAPGVDLSNKALADIITGVGWLLGEDLLPEDAMKRAL